MGQSSSKRKIGVVRVKERLNPECSLSSKQMELFMKEDWELGKTRGSLDKGMLKKGDLVAVLPLIS